MATEDFEMVSSEKPRALVHAWDLNTVCLSEHAVGTKTNRTNTISLIPE